MARILIADDMAVIREPIALALQRAGHEVRTASNGREVIAMLRRQVPDLLLLDVCMPEATGLDVLRVIRTDARLQSLPVVILTDMGDRETVLQAREFGVQDYLLKSAFSISELYRRIDTALERHKSATVKVGRKAGVESDTALQPSSSGTAGGAETHSSQGDGMESVEDLKPVMKRSELAEMLEGCTELKALSPTVAEVIKLANSPKASVEQISKAIRRDHAIALKILRMANSVAYASDDPADSVDKAVVRIGMKAIGQAVINISVIDHFSSASAGTGIDSRLFWEHSIGCGLIAAKIASALKSGEPDSAFTMGLIHDVGRFVYAEMLGERYDEVLESARKLQVPLELVEKRLLILNHADGMDRILHQWNFPRDLIDPIVFHHLSIGNIRRMAPRRVPEVATLALANRIAHAMMLGSSGNNSVYSTNEFCDALGIQPRVIHDIEAKMRDETDDLKFVMFNAGAADGWPDVREDVRKQIGSSFRPVFMSNSPEMDAFRIFCNQLAERSGDPPNIGVIHITDQRDRVAVSKAYQQAESDAGVSKLPLIVLSPGGKLQPEVSVLAGRQSESLATPFAVSRFASVCRRLLGGSATAQAA